MNTLSFKQLFATLFILFAALLAASALSAWTGPTATAPGGNVPAPINVGTTNQVKDAGLSLNALAIFGSQYIQDKLGVGVTSPVVSFETPGTIKIGSGGEVCQAVTEGAIRYNSSAKTIQYCNGSAWQTLQGQSSSGSVQYSASGTFTFSVPASYETLTVDVRGGGGGGQGGSGSPDGSTCSSGTDGTAGGSSSFNQNVIGNGGEGTNHWPGAQGTASGGDTNTTGGGGSGGGPGGAAVLCSWSYAGGAGGRAVKTYSAGQLSGNVPIVVGAGGTGGGGAAGGSNGGSGGVGSVTISWE